MKRFLSLVLCAAILVCCASCGASVRNAKTHQVDSELYSEKNIEAAIQTVKDEIRSDSDWHGVTLLEIYYAGDEITQRESEVYLAWEKLSDMDEMIVLMSSIDIDESGADGSFIPNYTCDHWSWLLVRKDGGEWELFDWGYI